MNTVLSFSTRVKYLASRGEITNRLNEIHRELLATYVDNEPTLETTNLYNSYRPEIKLLELERNALRNNKVY